MHVHIHANWNTSSIPELIMGFTESSLENLVEQWTVHIVLGEANCVHAKHTACKACRCLGHATQKIRASVIEF